MGVAEIVIVDDQNRESSPEISFLELYQFSVADLPFSEDCQPSAGIRNLWGNYLWFAHEFFIGELRDLIVRTDIIESKKSYISCGEWTIIRQINPHLQPTVIQRSDQLPVDHALGEWIDSKQSDSWPVGQLHSLIGSIGGVLSSVGSSFHLMPLPCGIYCIEYQGYKSSYSDSICGQPFLKWLVSALLLFLGACCCGGTVYCVTAGSEENREWLGWIYVIGVFVLPFLAMVCIDHRLSLIGY